MFASANGELKTRSEPKSHCRPPVSLKTPPLPFTCLSLRYSSRLQSATSSPNITMRGSRFISSRRQALMRSAIVLSGAASAPFSAGRGWTGPVCRFLDLRFRVLLEIVDSLLVENAFAYQEKLEARDGIAFHFLLALRFW